MNIYDFDKTIYDGDSTIDFYLFLLKKYPRMWANTFKVIKAFLNYKFKKYSKTEMKQDFYSSFVYIEDIDKEVKLFWDNNIQHIFTYYLARQKSDDIIISASPAFLVGEACKRLNIKHYLASPVDPKTGKYYGLNCDGQEKVRRLYEVISKPDIDNFYSDSISDLPLAKLAKKAYIIDSGQVKDWPKETLK